VQNSYPRFHLDHVQCKNLNKIRRLHHIKLAGMVIIVLHLQAPEEPKKSTEQEEKLKKLKEYIARRQEQLNGLAEHINELEK
jgi:hypothetical protein